jgi:hypothetical protein
MPVTSAFVYYVGNTAYDLRKVSQVWDTNGGTQVAVRFIDDEKTFVTFGKIAFEAAWQAALNAGGGGGGANWGAIGGNIQDQADLQAQFDGTVLINPGTDIRNRIAPTLDITGLSFQQPLGSTKNATEWYTTGGTLVTYVNQNGLIVKTDLPDSLEEVVRMKAASGREASMRSFYGTGAKQSIHFSAETVSFSDGISLPIRVDGSNISTLFANSLKQISLEYQVTMVAGGFTNDGATGDRIAFAPAGKNQVALSTYGTTAQIANIQEWRDSASTVLAAVTPTGDLRIKQLNYTWPSAHAYGVLSNDGLGNLSWANNRTGNALYVDIVYGNDTTGTRNDPNKPFLTIKAAVDSPSRLSGDRIVIRAGNHDITAGMTVSNALRIDLEAGSFVNVSTGVTAFTLNAGSSLRAKGNGGFGGPGRLYVTTASIFVYIDVMTFAGSMDAGSYFIDHPAGLLTLKVQGVASLSGAGGGLLNTGATTDLEFGQLSNSSNTALPALNLTGTIDVVIGKAFQSSTACELIRLNSASGGVIKIGSLTNSAKALARSIGGSGTVSITVDGSTYSTATVDPTIINEGGVLKVMIASIIPAAPAHPPIVRMSSGLTILDGGVYTAPAAAVAAVEVTGGKLVMTPDVEVVGGTHCVRITGGSEHEISGKLSGGTTGALYIDGLTVNAYSLRAVGLVTGSAGGVLRCTLPCSTSVAPTVITTEGYSLPVFTMT